MKFLLCLAAALLATGCATAPNDPTLRNIWGEPIIPQTREQWIDRIIGNIGKWPQ